MAAPELLSYAAPLPSRKNSSVAKAGLCAAAIANLMILGPWIYARFGIRQVPGELSFELLIASAAFGVMGTACSVAAWAHHRHGWVGMAGILLAISYWVMGIVVWYEFVSI